MSRRHLQNCGASRNRKAGFTLVEVLAAVFLTAVVMTVAITFFVDLSDATDAAAARARHGRQALAVLDRIARDLEGAYLVTKPAELDPLLHPWAFVAEGSAGGSGADRLQFVTRNYRPRNLFDHGSDVAVVTWMLRPAPDRPGYELLRAVSPGLPQPPGNEFPSADDDLFMVVAENIQQFGMRFLATEGEWVDEWDSTQLVDSSTLPRAAELELGFFRDQPEDGDFDDFGEFAQLDEGGEEPQIYTRRVMIPMEAIDVATMLAVALAKAAGEEAQQGDTDDEDEDAPGAEEQDFDDLEQEVNRLLESGGDANDLQDNLIR